MFISLDEPVWTALERLQILVNKVLIEQGRQPLRVSGVLSMVVQHALTGHVMEIQDEYEQLGAAEVLAHLTKLEPADASFLPRPAATGSAGTSQVPHGRRAHRGAGAPELNPKDPKRRTLSRAHAVKARADVPRQPRAPGQVPGGVADALERAGQLEAAAVVRRTGEAGRSGARLLELAEAARAAAQEAATSNAIEDDGLQDP